MDNEVSPPTLNERVPQTLLAKEKVGKLEAHVVKEKILTYGGKIETVDQRGKKMSKREVMGEIGRKKIESSLHFSYQGGKKREIKTQTRRL